jgi:hypothetical protein
MVAQMAHAVLALVDVVTTSFAIAVVAGQTHAIV